MLKKVAQISPLHPCHSSQSVTLLQLLPPLECTLATPDHLSPQSANNSLNSSHCNLFTALLPLQPINHLQSVNQSLNSIHCILFTALLPLQPINHLQSVNKLLNCSHYNNSTALLLLRTISHLNQSINHSTPAPTPSPHPSLLHSCLF